MTAKPEATNGYRSLTADSRSLPTAALSSWAGRLAESRLAGTTASTARTASVLAAPPGTGRETVAVRCGIAVSGLAGFR
jgi:hypothetical protein